MKRVCTSVNTFRKQDRLPLFIINNLLPATAPSRTSRRRITQGVEQRRGKINQAKRCTQLSRSECVRNAQHEWHVDQLFGQLDRRMEAAIVLQKLFSMICRHAECA